MKNWVEVEKRVARAAEESVRAYSLKKTFAGFIPKSLRARIDSWQFGHYGWTSPVNLMITACWIKWLYPSQDICKIWAKDAQNKPIPGSYSIRSFDERITVPLVSKLGVYYNFCSNNSGMQGTRAIEKTRVATRLNRNTKLDQRVLFDLSLFVNIMNDINDLRPNLAFRAFQYFIEIGCRKAGERKLKLEELKSQAYSKEGDIARAILTSLQEIKDPQFVKIIGVTLTSKLACYSNLFKGGQLFGAEGTKTGANARSKEPGDIWLEIKGEPILAVEVKDASKQFGFEILSAVEDRYNNNRHLAFYILLTAAESAVPEKVLSDKAWQTNIERLRRLGLKIHLTTFRNLLVLLSILGPIDASYIEAVNAYLSTSPDLKLNTLTQWKGIIAGL